VGWRQQQAGNCVRNEYLAHTTFSRIITSDEATSPPMSVWEWYYSLPFYLRLLMKNPFTKRAGTIFDKLDFTTLVTGVRKQLSATLCIDSRVPVRSLRPPAQDAPIVLRRVQRGSRRRDSVNLRKRGVRRLVYMSTVTSVLFLGM
jgi:hypothetical protein